MSVDIDSLCAWRVVELRSRGVAAGVEIVSYMQSGYLRYTMRVVREGGVIEDQAVLERLYADGGS